ncbi:rRNA methyltransferase 2, mitochondrial isoform X2 [Narcine bancroftii]|uniref:rRNA methyltransferase 2, mitochondrial isoform X2 n=1 Tax=Narcine bancroftii TaxID=1343680 RepID=UPI0038319167
MYLEDDMMSRVQWRLFHMATELLRKTPAEQRWLTRQQQDPFVKSARQQNYRCRSAFKLLEIDEKHGILRPGISVLDCGAAPGAWSQVAVDRVNATGSDLKAPVGSVLGVDLSHIPLLDGAVFLSHCDLLEPKVQARIQESLPRGEARVILSDVAPNASGIRELDQQQFVELFLCILGLAERVLSPNGTLLCKFWDGANTCHLQKRLTKLFGEVKILKPSASRKESSEIYFLAKRFRRICASN